MPSDNIPTSLHILLVENDPSDQEIFCQTLERDQVSYEITTCKQAEDALERLEADTDPFDVLVADNNLPGMAGIDLCRELIEREIPLPLVLMTEVGSEGLAAEALKAGVDDYLLKDVEGGYLELLPLVISDVVQKYRNRLASQQAEEHYRVIFENTGTASCIIEEDTTISLVNTKFEKLSGYSKAELEGQKKWTDFTTAKDLARMTEHHHARREDPDAAPRSYEFQFIDRDGHIKSIHLNIDLIPGTKKSVASLMDITEYKRAEREIEKRQRYLEGVLEATPSAIITLDKRNLIVEWNPGAKELFGYSREEAIGQKLDPLISKSNTLEEATRFTQEITSGKSLPPTESVRYRKDGSPVNVILTGSPILAGGEIIGTVGSYTNITEHKRAEQKIRQYMAQLEILKEVELKLISQLDLDNLLHSIVEHAIELLKGTGGGIGLYRPEQDVLGYSLYIGLKPSPEGTTVQRGEGFCGAVWETGEPLIVNDYQNWENSLEEWRPHLGHAAYVGTPVYWGNDFLGVLDIFADPPRAFSQADAELLNLLATYAAVAIRNAHLMQAEQEQRKLAETLAEAAAIVNSSLEFNAVLDCILEQIEQVIGGDTANVMMIEGDRAYITRWRGYERFGAEKFVSQATFHIPETSTLQQMLESGQSLTIPNTAAYSGWVDTPESHWLRSYIGAPIHTQGRVVGFLSADSATQGTFTSFHAQILQAFASHAGAAIENARLHQELRNHAKLLEQDVAERTRDLERRSVQVQAAATVARDATSAQELDDLLNNAVNLVRKRFGFYHAGLFLLDEEREYAILKAATGEAGRQMLERQHKLKVGEVGVVGYATGTGQPRIALDVDADAMHFKNPLLPKTRSEMALPLKVNDQVIGALDVQSTQGAAFDDEDAAVLQTMADQLAVAIERLKQTADLQAQRARLDAILNSTVDGIVVTDQTGKIIRANPVSQTWFTQTLSPEEADQLLDVVHDVATRSEEEPTELLALTGLDLEVKAAPISKLGRGEAATVVVIHDVSHLKALDHMKTRFITNISHELRTPITTIKLYAHLMKKQPEKCEKHLATLTQEANHQAQLIESILQISHIDAGRLEIEARPTSLDDLVETVADQHQSPAQEQGVALEYSPAPPGPMALVDSGQITQVLNNLVENGIRYTPEGGRVTISTGTADAKGRTWATATVKDTGMGISEEERPHIFDRFFRGKEPRAMQLTGTGLGLSIVQEVVKLHGGWVTVESEVGAGSTFTIWLPLASKS